MLLRQLELLKPHLAKVAQDVFETWDFQFDGGACDEIARQMASIIDSHLPHVSIIDGGWEGDNHAWLIVHDGMTACGVDIPWHYYERQGAGPYYWYPLENVNLAEEHVEVWTMNLADFMEDDND